MKNLLLYFVLIIALVVSCKKESTIHAENDLMVELEDQELISCIKKYLNENDIDPKSTIVLLTINTIGDREVIHISNDKRQYIDINGFPTYLSSLDGHLIFIYSTIEQYVSRDISTSINSYLSEFGVHLEDDDSDCFLPSYHPETWKLTKCESDSFLIQKHSGSGLSTDYAPCGYQFDYRTQKLDTFKILSKGYTDSLIRENLKKWKLMMGY